MLSVFTLCRMGRSTMEYEEAVNKAGARVSTVIEFCQHVASEIVERSLRPRLIGHALPRVRPGMRTPPIAGSATFCPVPYGASQPAFMSANQQTKLKIKKNI